MHVVLVVTRRVEVKYAGNFLDVDPARRDIRGDEHAAAPSGRLQGSVALDLGATPVQRDRMHTGVDELA